MRLLFSLLFLAPTTAFATEGLVMQWEEGQTRQYVVHTNLEPPSVIFLMARKNHQVRAVEMKLSTNLTCGPDTVSKNGWSILCKIDDIRLRAAIVEADHGLDILDEYDQMLTGATLRFSQKSTGQLRNVELEGVDRNTDRGRLIYQQLRQLLTRSLAGLDLGLPKKGDDQSREWIQRSPLIAGFISDAGSMGAIEVVHKITESDGDLHTVESAGRGILASGEMLSVGGAEQSATTVDMTITGTATFDTANGNLVSRRYKAVGVPAAGSLARAEWIQSASIKLLGDGESPAPLKANELLENARPEIATVP